MRTSMLIVLGAAWMAACAGGAPSPSASPSPPVASAAASAMSSSAPPASSTPAPSTDASVATPADAGAEAAAAVVADNSEWMDQCQDIGKDFEKQVRPDLKKCHADASKKEYQRGSVRITFRMDWDGKKKDVRTAEKSNLPDALVKCMLGVVKDAKFPDPDKCKGKDVTLIEHFPPK